MSVLDFNTIMSRRLSIDNNIYRNLKDKGFIVDTIDKILPQVYESMLERYKSTMKQFLIKEFKCNLYDTYLFQNEWNTTLKEYVNEKLSKDNISDIESTETINMMLSNIKSRFKILELTNVFLSDTYLISNNVKTFKQEFDIIQKEYDNRDRNTNLKDILKRIYNLMEGYSFKAIDTAVNTYNAFATQYKLITGDIVNISPITEVKGSPFFIDDDTIISKLSKGSQLNLNEITAMQNYIKKISEIQNDISPQIALLLGPPGIGKSESKYFYISQIKEQITNQLNETEKFLLNNNIDVNKLSIEQLKDKRRYYIQQLSTSKDVANTIKIINYLDTYISIYSETSVNVQKDEIKEHYIENFCRKTEKMYINKDVQAEHPAGKKGMPTVEKIMQNSKDTINIIYPEDLSAANRLSPEYVQFINYDEIDKEYMLLLKSAAVSGSVGGESSGEKIAPTGFYFASGNLGKLDNTPEDNTNIQNFALERRFKTFVAITDKDAVLKHFQTLNNNIENRIKASKKIWGDLDNYTLCGDNKIDEVILLFLERYGGDSKNSESGWLNSIPTGGKKDNISNLRALDFKGYMTPATWKALGKEIYYKRKNCEIKGIDSEKFYTVIKETAKPYLGVDTDIFMEVFRTIDGGLNKVYNFFKPDGAFDELMNSKEIRKTIAGTSKEGQPIEKSFISFNKLTKKIEEFLFDKKEENKNVLEDNIFVTINSFITVLNTHLDNIGNFNKADNKDGRKEIVKKTIGILAFMEVLYRKDNDLGTGFFSKIETNMKKHPNFSLFENEMLIPTYKLLQKTEGKDFEKINIFNILNKSYDVVEDNVLKNFE